MADIRRLAELGMVPPLAKEVAAQITSGIGDKRRLAELSMVTRLASEVATQITTKVTSVRRLAELSMPPVLANELVAQIQALPSWVDRANDGTLPIYSADYVNGRYWVAGQVYTVRTEFEAAALAALMASGFRTGTSIVWLTTPSNHSATQNIWNFSDGTSQNRIALRRSITPNTQYDVTTGNVSQAQIFAGTLADSTAVRVACAWAVNDFQVSALGGGSLGGAGSVPLGLNNIARLSGYETVYAKETVFASRLPVAEVASWTLPSNGFIADGDSFIQGTAGGVIPTKVSTVSSRAVVNYGVGGNTLEQIMARRTAVTDRVKQYPILLWDGDQNGIVSVSDYVSKFQSGLAGYVKPLVIPCCVDYGQIDVSQEVAIRNALQAVFPAANFLDWRTVLTLDGNGNPTSAMYQSPGTDNIHLSTAAMDLMATAISNKMSSNGW